MCSRPPSLNCPRAWLEQIPSLSGPVVLVATGRKIQIEITAPRLERVYLPLLAWLDELATGGNRILAALAGIPGGGKSTFVAVMAHIAGHVLTPGRFAVVGMDGWHYPNTVLDVRTTQDTLGKVIPLRERKGGPESFDVAAMAEALRLLKSADGDVALPMYDRRLHDPVPNGLVVRADARIVLVEGNYLLSDHPPWDRVSALFSPRLFIECDPAAARVRIIGRHIRGGATAAEAEAKFDRNDRLNIEAVQATAGRADVRIRIEPVPGLQWNA